MKLTLDSTTRIITVNGAPARVWEGKTDAGTPFYAFITGLAVPNNVNVESFERELLEQQTPNIVGNFEACKTFDEFLAAYLMQHRDKRPGNTTVLELMEWSADTGISMGPLAVESVLDGTCSKCGLPCVDTSDVTGPVPLLCGACMFLGDG